MLISTPAAYYQISNINIFFEYRYRNLSPMIEETHPSFPCAPLPYLPNVSVNAPGCAEGIVVANPAVDIRRRDVNSHHITTEHMSPHSTEQTAREDSVLHSCRAKCMAVPEDEPLLSSDWQSRA